MSSLAILMMVLICGFVWGGFCTLLTRAVVSEGRKQAADRAADGGAS